MVRLIIFDISIHVTIDNTNLMLFSVNTRSQPRRPKRTQSSQSHAQNNKQQDSGKEKSTNRTRSSKGNNFMEHDNSNGQDMSKSYALRGFKPGTAFLTKDELDKASASCQELQKWYMDQTKGKRIINNSVAIGLTYLEEHLLNGVGYILLMYEDLFDLFKLDAIDVGLLSCFSL